MYCFFSNGSHFIGSFLTRFQLQIAEEPPAVSEGDLGPHGHETKPHYGAVGDKNSPVAKQKTRTDAWKSNAAKTAQKHVENCSSSEQVKTEDSCRASSPQIEVMDRTVNSRSRNRGYMQRGHARKGRGSHQMYKSDLEDSHMQRHFRGGDSGDASGTGHTLRSGGQMRGRHEYQQQRSRRKFDVHQKAHPHMKSIGEERTDRLRSPVVSEVRSSEGYDEEWETASESSARATREDRSSSVRNSNRQLSSSATPSTLSPLNSHQGGGRSVPFSSSPHVENASASANAERSYGSKNAQPASRTCQSPSGNYSNYKNNREPNLRNVSDALAGLDINNIASVVVIDDHLVETASIDASEEFEEVLNKRAKKQKALLLQAKLEAEEKRKIKEKERHIRAQGKRLIRHGSNRKDFKKGDAKKEQKHENENWTGSADKGKPKQQERKKLESNSTQSAVVVDNNGTSSVKNGAETHSEESIKTVWNSAHIAGQKESVEGAPSIIPSPIARPNPRSKSSASDTPPPFQDIVRRQIVELPVSLSSSQPLRGDKYDFTFDPRLHEEQMSNEKVLTSLSTGASSEAGSMTDDIRLKEKLYKVKGLWSGEEKDSESSLPSNVAKVKPQPQSGSEHLQNDGKAPMNVQNGCQTVPPKSPGIAPFPGLGGLMFSPFPVMFGDMSIGRGYTSVGSVLQPLIPPSNASSPPIGQPLYQQPPSLAATATMNQRPLQIRSNYVDQNAMFATNLPPSQNVSWNLGSMLDNACSAALSGTPSPQLAATHMSSSVQPPPNMILQHRGPAPGTIPQNHSQSLAHGYGVGVSNLAVAGGHVGPPPPHPPPNVAASTALVPPPPIPPPELMNIPPPIGSQRVAPVTIQYAGFPPNPSLSHAVHPSHNFAQPPPNVRFAHPPPPLPNQDSQWDNGIARPFMGSRPQLAAFSNYASSRSSSQMNTGLQGNRWGLNNSRSSLSTPSQ
ncbi:hypothetical protein OESDEN_04905 [Oesophagostomum dentatum]|uniref:Uncharacterized protein n=1 Tax=Oesophagostomum dentatum TaxID=61180 RepID=A0A0B1TH95_OESDE|nr:hypothetical protein OESDEN_04905 [Oesophagostomum dentatum]